LSRAFFMIKRSIAYFLLSFAVCLAVGALVRDGGPHPSPFDTIDHFMAGIPVEDPSDIAKAAKDLYAYGRVTQQDAWVFLVRPPGSSALEAAILRLFGPDAPLVATLQILASLAWAGVFLQERQVLAPLIGLRAASIVPFGVLLFPGFRQFLVEPDSVIFAETFAMATFFSGVWLFLISLEKDSIARAALGGLCLGVACYFRAQVELITLAATVLAVPFGVLRLSPWPFREGKADRLRMAKMAVAFLIVAHAVMIPWRLRNWVETRSFRWVRADVAEIWGSLNNPDFLRSHSLGFFIEGGGNLGCGLEPSVCGKNDASIFYHVYFSHFLQWESIKASLLPKYWFASIDDWAGLGATATNADIFWNGVLALCVPITFACFFTARRYRWIAALIWITVSFCGYLVVVLCLVHFEARYFFLPKLFFFQMAVLSVATVCKERALASARHEPVSAG